MNNIKILVAKVLKTKGLRGEVKLKSYTENILSIKNYSLVDENNISYIIDEIYEANDLVVATIKGINTKDAAEAILGKNLYVYRCSLPPTDKNSYYIADLLNLDVFDINEKMIGKIANIYNFGAGDILEININHKAYMMPFNKDIILDINLKDGKVILSEIYKQYM